MSLEFTDMESIMSKANEIGSVPVLSSLKEQRSELHPDRNGGEFKSEEEKRRYHFLDEAVKQVEKSQLENGMIPVSQLPALIETISNTVGTQRKLSPIELERAYRESFRSELSHKYMGRKVGSGGFAAVTGFLFTQSQGLIEHPIIGPFFKTTVGMEVLGVGFAVSLVMFVLTWTFERREEAISNFLLSEEALREIYSIVLENSKSGEIETGVIRSSIRKRFMRGIRAPFDLFFRPRLSSGIMDKILEVQIERLIDRKVLVVVEKPSIERVYRIVS